MTWLRIVFSAIGLALAVVAFLAFVPTQLGGRASYIIVNGNSMEPVYQRGDLVRNSDQYQVGDIVAYQHPEIGPIIHRIIEVRDRNYLLVACLLVLAAVSTSGLTASNTVPERGTSDLHVVFNPGPIVPAECVDIDFDSTISDNGGLLFGSNRDDLIIGGPSAQLIFSGNGSDCVFGGGGNDLIHGDNGRDILLGGPGDDIIGGESAPDTCYGGPGNDTFWECETTIDP